MSKIKFQTTLIPITLMATLACCGGKSKNSGADLRSTPVAKMELGTFRDTVSFDTGDVAQALVDSSWRPLGDSMEGVRELRAGPRGSVVRIGDARLWMRSGSHLRLMQNSKGNLVVDLKSGQARLRGAKNALLFRAGEGLPIPESDVLLSHHSAASMMVATRLRPQAGAWSLELENAPEQRGIGSLEAGQGDAAAPLELRRVNVSVTVTGGMAITEVEHIFFNPSPEQREGTFRFPAPDGVMVTGLAMEIGGRMMEGEFVEKIKARQVYESIVDEMQDPALLEWQQGGWFKLRVFPIEGKSEKKVVLRYAAPLQKSLEGYEYRYLATPPEQSQVGHFSLKVNNKVATEIDDLNRAQDIVYPFAETAVPRLVVEDQDEYSYAALTISPNWKADAVEPNTRSKRQILLALDSSRSALESRELSTTLMTMILAELTPDDEFAFFAHDIEAREIDHGFVRATPENVERALAYYSKLEMDGASDLDATLQYAKALSEGRKHVQIVYIGDGTPSWGRTSEKELAKRAAELGSSTLFAAVLGRGASLSLWRNLTGGKEGTVVRPHTEMEARKLAFFLAEAPTIPRMNSVRVSPMDGVDIFPSGRRTLFDGEEYRVLMRAPKGKMPTQITMESLVSGKKKKREIPLREAQKSSMVAMRFASEEIAKLTRADADKDIIVAMSRKFGVMSKHTSLLVLESEEAYKQHQIERRKKEEEKKLAGLATPQISGGDLDNLGGREASLSPDHIQPGDPEVRIPAPADARSVVLIFPFGETKIAHYDEESRTWIARFLISPETADGEYWVRVRIEHADGHLEDMKLPYTVDTSPPAVALKVRKLPRNRYAFVIEQIQELDAIRVEVQLPWGQTRRIYRKQEGLFRGVVQAPEPLGSSVKVRIVVTDEALNQRVVEMDVPVEGL